MACTGETDSESTWIVDAVDLGAPVATGSGFEFSSPQMAWLAAEHVVADLTWSWPATNVPLLMWEDVLMGENVSDEGTCPYLTGSGSALTWKSDCRSQDGYDWYGDYTIEETEDGSRTIFAYTFGLVVASDVEGRAFDSINLNGRISYVDGNDSPLVRSSQTNMVVAVSGYWARGFEDTLEQAWNPLAITGRWEGQLIDGVETITVDATLDLGELGGFTAIGTLIDDACLVEPKGTLTLVGQQTAKLVFHGDDGCDGCADFTLDGERQANACRNL